MRLLYLTILFVLDAVVAGPSKCNECSGNNSASCSSREMFCASDGNSLGTTHCASIVGKYLRYNKGGNVMDLFYRGCFNCSSKKEACFSLGGFLKGDFQTLLECEIECCTSDNCNNQFPALSLNAITVFTPNAAGPAKCYKCLAKDADVCFSSQVEQTCPCDFNTLGTTHCGSAVVTYRDKNGNIRKAFFRGCLNCADKKAACALIGGSLKEEKFTWLECEIECCTENYCNRQLIPGMSTRETTGHPSMAPSVLGKRAFHVFFLVISIILHHF